MVGLALEEEENSDEGELHCLQSAGAGKCALRAQILKEVRKKASLHRLNWGQTKMLFSAQFPMGQGRELQHITAFTFCSAPSPSAHHAGRVILVFILKKA